MYEIDVGFFPTCLAKAVFECRWLNVLPSSRYHSYRIENVWLEGARSVRRIYYRQHFFYQSRAIFVFEIADDPSITGLGVGGCVFGKKVHSEVCQGHRQWVRVGWAVINEKFTVPFFESKLSVEGLEPFDENRSRHPRFFIVFVDDRK